MTLLRRFALALLPVAVAFWWVAPREQVDLNASFDPRRFGEGVQVYFESVESLFPDIVPGVEKRVSWQPEGYERRTSYSVLYVHGFSASSEEIRPLPDLVADALGANLVYTRLRGHGRGSAAMNEGDASAWMVDVAEGLAAARATGERVVVIAASTGATLAVAAATDPDLSSNVVAMVLISPNFAINDPLAWMLRLPFARHWVPLLMGGERRVEARSPQHAQFWTTTYGWAPVVSMAALVRIVTALDLSQITIPALFVFSDDDIVVRADATRAAADLWGGPVGLLPVRMGPGDDPNAHVIAGDILSPGQTEGIAAHILSWLQGQGIE